MALSDVFSSLMQKLRQGPFGTHDDDHTPNLPNGGHTGYHPVVDKRRGQTAEQSAYAGRQTGGFQQAWNQTQRQYAFQQNAAQAQQTAWQPAPEQPQPGWQQGMDLNQPPVMQSGEPQQPWQQTGYAPGGMQTGYAPAGASAWQPMQTAYQQPQTAWQPMQTSWQPQAEIGYQQAGQAPEATRHRRRQETAQPQQADNVTYMPGNFIGEDGVAYRHVERLAQPLSAATCYRLIEFMRNGESVVVNTELIRDDRENQRCLDLLYGAAFTMQCSFTRISARSIYLIAPASVSVIPYESIRQLNEQDAASKWPGFENAHFRQEEASARRGRPFRAQGEPEGGLRGDQGWGSWPVAE